MTFADMAKGGVEDKIGDEKIRLSCEEAHRRGLDYVWVVTCCIYKSSSAELSEAINSTYTWYKGAQICYAHLADFSVSADSGVSTPMLAKSRWFTRGWILQELIAPTDLVFFSCEWIELGTKENWSIILADITRISTGILTGSVDFRSTSTAKRMSWALRRATTRVEDIAYCLMGLLTSIYRCFTEKEKRRSRDYKKRL